MRLVTTKNRSAPKKLRRFRWSDRTLRSIGSTRQIGDNARTTRLSDERSLCRCSSLAYLSLSAFPTDTHVRLLTSIVFRGMTGKRISTTPKKRIVQMTFSLHARAFSHADLSRGRGEQGMRKMWKYYI